LTKTLETGQGSPFVAKSFRVVRTDCNCLLKISHRVHMSIEAYENRAASVPALNSTGIQFDCAVERFQSLSRFRLRMQGDSIVGKSNVRIWIDSQRGIEPRLSLTIFPDDQRHNSENVKRRKMLWLVG